VIGKRRTVPLLEAVPRPWIADSGTSWYLASFTYFMVLDVPLPGPDQRTRCRSLASSHEGLRVTFICWRGRAMPAEQTRCPREK
jgi:hypothetical protein